MGLTGNSTSLRSTREAPEPRCLVIVPVFNERESIGPLIRHLRQTLPDFHILVVDDGSTDDTAQQVPPGTAVVSLPFNLGIGGAMQTGYRYAAMHGYDIAVQCDGDGQHRPNEVLRLVEELKKGEADLVVGSRFLNATTYRQTRVRKVGSLVLRGLIRLLTGLKITDCTSGFRAGNRRVINAFAHWYPEDYPEPEVILLLHRAGFRIAELQVRMRQRKSGSSSISLLAGLFYMIKVSTCLLLNLMRDPWPAAKIEGAVGGFNTAPLRSRRLVARVDREVVAAFSARKGRTHEAPAIYPPAHWGGSSADGRKAAR
ncbi:MAG: glycosyltransferase family 2 protein [Phycisphaerales bacterium]|nr:glycosyltransferase family 2 protein [Phycisphaerales bacterium]